MENPIIRVTDAYECTERERERGERKREIDKQIERKRERESPRRISKADTAFAGKLQYNARPLRKAEFITARLHA